MSLSNNKIYLDPIFQEDPRSSHLQQLKCLNIESPKRIVNNKSNPEITFLNNYKLQIQDNLMICSIENKTKSVPVYDLWKTHIVPAEEIFSQNKIKESIIDAMLYEDMRATNLVSRSASSMSISSPSGSSSMSISSSTEESKPERRERCKLNLEGSCFYAGCTCGHNIQYRPTSNFDMNNNPPMKLKTNPVAVSLRKIIKETKNKSQGSLKKSR
jgi:hypothetical protein